MEMPHISTSVTRPPPGKRRGGCVNSIANGKTDKRRDGEDVEAFLSNYDDIDFSKKGVPHA